MPRETRINKKPREVRNKEIYRGCPENQAVLSIAIRVAKFTMPGDACVVCGNARKKAPQLSYHRFPSDPERRSLWLHAFQLTEEQIRLRKPGVPTQKPPF